MRVALVTDYAHAPAAQEFPAPVPQQGQMLVDVAASAIHPRVRSQADGSHYTSTEELPLIPGIDGVGTDPEGRLRYFILPDTNRGAMAEQTAIDPRRSVLLPDGVDPVTIAAAMNPAMSSWIALRRRIEFQPGMRVLILGATGNAGRFAVQIARRLGASHVTAVGRNSARLSALTSFGADAVVELDENPEQVEHGLATAGRTVDIVLDYLWGAPATSALRAIVPARDDDDRPLTWIQIGSIAGADARIPAAALRATKLRILGSGQGSVSTEEILTELPELAHELSSGDYDIAARAVPLQGVTEAWAESAITTDRLVLTP